MSPSSYKVTITKVDDDNNKIELISSNNKQTKQLIKGKKWVHSPEPADEEQGTASDAANPKEAGPSTHTKCHKLDAAADSQSRLDAHLCEQKPKECVIPYSDALFHEATIEWLIETDQLIDAVNHKSFKYMIDTAARATNDIKIPSRRQMWQAIIDLFKCNLTKLCKWLLSDAVKGRINLTCDAWQASNVDGYFAITGSWV
ncbi:hypothetical protein DFH29DRAFT_1007373 [Suillus ampliporus]|nr:hypothetical protein DFH29DRAFT_1007373 [Suillus ampliporus]